MKIKNIILTCSVLAGIPAMAQSSLPFDEQYFTSEKYLINPSFVGSSEDIVFKASHRRQWDNLPDAPETTIVSIHGNVVDRLGVGMYFLNDQNGNTKTNSFNLAAAYHIPIGNELKREDGQFSFGTSLSFAGTRFTGVVEDPNDPVYQDKSAVYIPYVNFGASVQYKGWMASASILDIPLSYNDPMVKDIEPSPKYYYGMLGKRFNITQTFQLEPMAAYRFNDNDESRLDANLRAKVLFGENAVWLGANYRLDWWADTNQSTSISPIIGAEIGRWNMAFSYNIGLSDLAIDVNNGFSVSLGYNLENFFNPQYK